MDFVKANLSNKQLIDVLGLYPLSVEDISIGKLTGIANDNYRVIGNNFDIALKIYSHGQSDELKIRKEIEAQQLFQKAGIKVPEFIKGKNNEILQKYLGFNVTVSRFIEGEVFDKVIFSSKRMFEVGKLIAKVEHTAEELDISSFSSKSLLEEFDYVNQNLVGQLEIKNYKWDLTTYYNNVNFIRDIARTLDSHAKPQFLHKDIWPWNLIEAKDGIYILDFNDWSIGDPVIEIAVPLLEFSMFKSAVFNYQVAKNIIDGYKAVNVFKYSANKLWETVLFICFLYFPYNVIQSDDPFESEIYLKRIETLLKSPHMFNELV